MFLGDLVGYGADPRGVVEIVRDHVGRGAVAVRGNHDDAIHGSAAYMNDSALAAIEYARAVLSVAQATFLKNLPMIVQEENRHVR